VTEGETVDWTRHVLIIALSAVAAALVACPITDDDDDDDSAMADDDSGVDDDDTAADDDATYTGPQGANVNLLVEGSIDGQDVQLSSVFEGAEVVGCGPEGDDDIIAFRLETDPGLAGTDGQLVIRAGGFLADTTVNPAQSLGAAEDGGIWQVVLPAQPTLPFSYDEGTCFIYILSDPESCYGNPSIPHCGNLSCGSEAQPMRDGAGNGVWLTGTFNCWQ
jgi:hypothetical protein